MTAPVHLHALDVHVAVRCQDAALAEALQIVAVDLLSPSSGHPVQVVVQCTGGGPWRVRSPHLDEEAADRSGALELLLTAVNLGVVAHTTYLAVHAGVVTRSGRTIVLPAASGTGKSTLVAALLTRGWSYVSDEALALEWSSGRVRPYPRPVALSAWSSTALHLGPGTAAGRDQVFVPRSLGAAVDWSPGPVTDVVLLDRTGASTAPISGCHRQDVLVALLRRGFTHLQDLPAAMTCLGRLVRHAEVHRLVLGNPRTSAASLEAAVLGRTRLS